MWIISNRINGELKESLCFAKNGFYVYITDDKSNIHYFENGISLLEGNIYNKNSKDNNYKVDILEIYDKYEKEGEEFIRNLAGEFILVLIVRNKLLVYGSRFGIMKFFFQNQNGQFTLSDTVWGLKRSSKLIPSKFNIVVYCLTYHFAGGLTAFDGVFHNQPGEFLKFQDDVLELKTYWNPSDLLRLTPSHIKINQIIEGVKKYIYYTLEEGEKISLSLTGGADTRNLLAYFLSIGIKPHLYTYGHPDSADCIRAVEIARELHLDHVVHDINMDSDNFENYARKIIRITGGMSSIHRAHRLIAVEFEHKFAQTMYLGTLGGEFIRGVSEDDYIVPSIVYENWLNVGLTKEMLKAYFTKNYLKYNEDIAYSTLQFLNEEPYFKGSVVERKFNTLVYITAHLHDAQDINLYSTVMDYVFTPFLDIDYLELLFSSEYSFIRKELFGNPYLKRLENPVFASRFLKETYKPLLKFNYSGGHRPSEVIVNKYLAAIFKVIRQKLQPKYVPNFSLDNWMEKFVKENLPICYDYNILKETFNLDLLMDRLANGKHMPKESYWIKFTNPIMMRFIIEEANKHQ